MYFTAQSKKSAGVITFKQIIFVFALLIVLVGQVSAIPVALPEPVRHFEDAPSPDPATVGDSTVFY